MAGINGINNFASLYNTANSSILGRSQQSGQSNNMFNLSSDYASIKNGSQGKFLRSYYAEEQANKIAGQKDNATKITGLKTSADSLKASADALNDRTLLAKNDRESIIKAAKSFIDDYNKIIDEAGASNTMNVLRNASWMTSMTKKNEGLLMKAGITIGEGNKLKLDESLLKNADKATLNTLLDGRNSYIGKVSQKAANISRAVTGADTAYTRGGKYSDMTATMRGDNFDKKA